MGNQIIPRASYCILQITLFLFSSSAFAQSSDKVSGKLQVEEASISDIHSAIESRSATCEEIVEQYLARIEAYNLNGPSINAVITVNPNALGEAAQLDATFAQNGFTGPLHCTTVLVKDQVETNDMPTTYGSALFAGFIPPRNATIIDKIKSAGGIIIGKATMGEFASGYAGSAFGFCRNVYDLTRSPSSSSCGTGTGVAASFATVGIAEDTGGSIRGPAAVSNAVGLRPTVPLVSRYGMFPATPSQDTLGPLTRTVTDTAILLDVIAGYDPNDPITSDNIGKIPQTYTAFLEKNQLKGMRIGVIRQPLSADAEPESEDYAKVRAVIDQAIVDLQSLGAEIVDPVSIPNVLDLIDRSATSYETEVAVNNYLAQLPNSPIKTFREIATSDVVVPTRRAALRNALDKTPEDPAHLAALAAREDLRSVVQQLMKDNHLDALVYATFDRQPTLIPDDVLTNPNAAITIPGWNRRLSSFLGFPALTVPAGFTVDALPVGLEFLGRPYTEGNLIEIGYGYEQGTMHRQPPSTTPPLPNTVRIRGREGKFIYRPNTVQIRGREGKFIGSIGIPGS